MEFDSADMAIMESNGSLYDVILHEMGHVLGIGTIWSYLGLLSGAGTSNPRFTGSQATAAYNAIFGTTATGVPVENTGGAGTRDGHWRESVFRDELMTGWISGSVRPLSQVTAASLADMGYTVNLNGADFFSPSGSLVSGTSTESDGGTSLQLRAGGCGCSYCQQFMQTDKTPLAEDALVESVNLVGHLDRLERQGAVETPVLEQWRVKLGRPEQPALAVAEQPGLAGPVSPGNASAAADDLFLPAWFNWKSI
jgi:hypothetical protein